MKEINNENHKRLSCFFKFRRYFLNAHNISYVLASKYPQILLLILQKYQKRPEIFLIFFRNIKFINFCIKFGKWKNPLFSITWKSIIFQVMGIKAEVLPTFLETLLHTTESYKKSFSNNLNLPIDFRKKKSILWGFASSIK